MRKWYINYEKLEKYYEEHGNIDVSRGYVVDGFGLGRWVAHQRQVYKGNCPAENLSQDKIDLLNKLGMKWIIKNDWDGYYKLLEDYYLEHGNVDVPVSYEKDGVKLGNWVAKQRQIYKGNCPGDTMSQEHIDLFNRLGMKWTITRDWNDYYKLLEDYVKKYGDANVPNSYEINGVKLGYWLHNQRSSYKGDGTCKLTQERIELLNKIGVNWTVTNRKNNVYNSEKGYKKWYSTYEVLVKYYEEHGNIDVPFDVVYNGIKLGSWLYRQRIAYLGNNKHVITQERIDLLNKLGMNWTMVNSSWYQSYQLLEEYYKEHGNIDVPVDYQVGDNKLGWWLVKQRQSYAGKIKKIISHEQIILLNKLGVDWSPVTTRKLNKKITDMKIYNEQLIERTNNVLRDLTFEEFNEIDSKETQEEIEKELIRRIWR